MPIACRALVAQAEQHLALAFTVGDPAALAVALSVELAISVDADGVVGSVDDGHVDRRGGVRAFRRSPQVPGPDKAVAAGHPGALLAFGVDDRIKGLPVVVLQGDDAAAALVKGRKVDPGLERLFGDVFSEGRRRGEGILSVENKAAVLQPGRAVQLRVHGADLVLQTAAGEVPQGDRPGTAGSLQVLVSLARMDLLACRFFELGDLCVELRDLRVEGGDLLLARLSFGLRTEVALSMEDTIEDRLDTVVVRLRNGVEFVRVAAGAVDRHTEKALGHAAHQVLHLLFPGLHALGLVSLAVAGLVVGAADKHAGGDDAVGHHRLENISGDLLHHEAVIGFVGVEAADHVVSIVPGVVPKPVVLESLALGIARDIQPVPTPVLSVARRSQQPFDQVAVGPGILVVDEGLHLGGGWRESQEGEVQPSNQGRPVGRGARLEPFFPEPREDEGIDGVAYPVRALDCRRRGLFDRLQGPVIALDSAGAGGILRPDGSLVDPGTQSADLGRCEPLAARRHHELLVSAGNQQHEPALNPLAGQDDRPGVAAFERRGPQVEPESALLLLRAMACFAGAAEEGTNLCLEIDLVLGGWRQLVLGRGQRPAADQQEKQEPGGFAVVAVKMHPKPLFAVPLILPSS